jgi:diaminopimelate epimerase
MRFAKYHGIGNDFVMIADPADRLRLTAELARRLCDRRLGIGADGVIRVAPGGDGAALFMDHVNRDGSQAEMCGNGIRCLTLFARAEGLTDDREFTVGTRAGNKSVRIVADDLVEVDMGPPLFAPESIPVRTAGADALHTKLELLDEVVEAACLSMGNPHAVLFVDDVAEAPVTSLGPRIEQHAAFPNRTNVEFVRAMASDRIEVRVWERGVGETLACGTGACAAAVAARLLAGGDETVTVSLPGGELDITWTGSRTGAGPVLMTGPAIESFTGEVALEGA